MEAEGHGPFVHGFADFLPLPPAVLASAPTDGSRAPASTYTEPQLWQRSVDFLLAMDDGDGVIRDSIYDFGGTDSLPNVYAAVSCIAGAALLEARTRQQHGQLELGSGTGERIEAMLERLLTGGCNDQLLCRTDRDEILWAYTYRIRLLSRWITLRPADKQRLLPPLQQAVDALTALQPDSGMWFHEYGNPFASATALQSLKSGSDAGAVVERARIDTGLRALLHCRTKVGAFTYGDPGQGEPKAGFEGAAGRMPLCELALACWGKSGADALQQALGKGFEHHGLLAHVRKYDDHADQYHYGGFFFWFDMLGRTEAVMALPAGEARDKFQAQQRQIVLDLPEFDGCFVDSHELGRAYGTAMALLCLAALRP